MVIRNFGENMCESARCCVWSTSVIKSRRVTWTSTLLLFGVVVRKRWCTSMKIHVNRELLIVMSDKKGKKVCSGLTYKNNPLHAILKALVYPSTYTYSLSLSFSLCVDIGWSLTVRNLNGFMFFFPFFIFFPLFSVNMNMHVC